MSAALTDSSDASALEDRMPDWFRTTRRSLLAVAVLAVLFTIFAHRPLRHTDLWGHLAYGRLIWQTKSIPETEPFMPLAKGMPLVDTAWLSQLIGYGTYSLGSVTALQFLYAAAVTFCLSLLLWQFLRKTDSLAAGFTGLAAFLWIEWQALGVIRPQLAGLCCFVALLAFLSSGRRRKLDWFLVPAIMAAWANLHGSFPVGLVLLGTLCIGRAIDVARRSRAVASRERQRPEVRGRRSEVGGRNEEERTADHRPPTSDQLPVSFPRRSLRAPACLTVWRDARFRRLLLLTQLAAVAVLINPYGWQLYAEVFTVAANPNLADLREWLPLTLRMKQGQAAFAVALALIVLFRFTPRRIASGELLLLVGFGAASLWSSRLLVWWGPLAASSLVLHGYAVLRKRRMRGMRDEGMRSRSRALPHSPSPHQPGTGPLVPRRSFWTVASIGLCWIAFALSPFGTQVLRGEKPNLEDAVSAETPVGAAEFLREHPPRGLVFNSFEWGDYFVWAAPDESNVFVTTHAHLVPREVWLDYLRVLTAADGWNDLLARYGADIVVINRYDAGERELLTRLRGSDKWRVVYQDDRSVIFERSD